MHRQTDTKQNTRHRPLSTSLAEFLGEGESRTLTLNHLMERTRGRGLYLAMILLAIPFVTPIPLPGLSTAVGLAIAIMAARLALRLPPRLPKILGSREISRNRLRRFIRSSTSLLRTLEKVAKPRHGEWLQGRAARLVNAFVLVFMGLLLALPIPPVMPFTNSLPSWGIILMSLALMEGDGLLVWVAYLVVIGTTLYLCFFSGLAIAGLHHLFDSWRAT
jgi:hypothetical protein